MTPSFLHKPTPVLGVVLLPLVLLTLSGCPGTTPGMYQVDVLKDIVYAMGNVSDGTQPRDWQQEDLLLDVYEPVGAEGARPALILVHGGDFTGGSKEKEEIVQFATYFTQRGYVCFSINYRLRDDLPPAPDGWDSLPLTSAAHAAMVDVKAAVRFVRAEADTYGVDPDRIVLLGESAGAIAAVPSAVTESDDFATDGPDFPIPAESHPGVSTRVHVYVHFWGNADHVLYAVSSDDPPVMIVHGTDDDNAGTNFNSSERFDTALNLFGVPHEFYEAEGFGHGAWDYRNRGRNLRTLTFDFVQEYLP